jgi:HK97 family phage portal protein
MILSSLFEHRASLENPAISWSDPNAFSDTLGISHDTDAGVAVTHRKAISLAAYWAAVKMISGDVSKLPLEVFLRDGEDRKADHKHPVYDRINLGGMANEEVSALRFWRRFMASALVYENAYAWCRFDNGGRLVGLYNLLPDRTTVAKIRGQLWVLTEVSGPGGSSKVEPLPYSDCLHVEGLCINNLVGEDMVYQAREDIAQALAARSFTARFFKNGAHIGGVLHVPPGTTPKAKAKVEKGLETKFGSADNAFKTMVLRDGFKWFATMAKPQEAQLAELDEQQARNAARRFLMRPSKLGVQDSTSYNSLEQDRRDYQDTTLSYWLVAIKSECNTKLLSEEDRTGRFIDYNINALAWADAATVATIGYQGVAAGVLEANEVRRWWNLPPREEQAAGAVDVQQQALNGAQIASLVQIVSAVTAGQLPVDSARPMIGASFPTLPESVIDDIVGPLAEFVAAMPEPQPDAQPQRSADAAAENLRAALRRVSSRLAVRATRLAKQPTEFLRWLDNLKSEREACERITAIPVQLAKAAGIVGPDEDPLGQLLTEYHRALDAVASSATADQLAGEVAAVLDQLDKSHTTQGVTHASNL